MEHAATPSTVISSLESDADALAFREISEEWLTHHFAVEASDVKALEDPRRSIMSAGGDVLLARDVNGAEVLGCVALIAYPGNVFELAKMGVRSSARRRGIGRLLVMAAIDRAGELGAEHVFLSSNHVLHTALHLYRSCGFVQVEPRQIPVEDYYAWRLERADVYMVLNSPT